MPTPRTQIILLTLLLSACDSESSRQSRLMIASRDGDIREINQLLDRGVDVNLVDERGYTALMLASSQGRVEVIDLLVRRGAKVNQMPARGASALSEAIKYSRYKAISALLKAGADPNVGPGGARPLILAAALGDAEVVRLLLAAGAKPNLRAPSTQMIPATSGDTPLNYAVTSYSEITRLLIAAGADLEAPVVDRGPTPLGQAAYSGNLEAMRMLLDAGAKIDGRDEKGQTAVIWATSGDKPDAIKLLTLRGANLNARNKFGSTALLMFSNSEGRIAAINALIAAGADINAKDPQGFTALDLADRAGQRDKTAIYMAAGAKHGSEK